MVILLKKKIIQTYDVKIIGNLLNQVNKCKHFVVIIKSDERCLIEIKDTIDQAKTFQIKSILSCNHFH